MIILPAIDLKDGKCVRLLKGDFGTVSQVADDPVQTAAHFEACGAKIVHMVDLDGALKGRSENLAVIQAVSNSVNIKVELGGGIRSMENLRTADEIGVYRMIIGSAAVTDRTFVEEACQAYGIRIAVGIDARDGRVRTQGWTEDSGIDAIGFAKEMACLGVKNIIFTDIDTDGTLAGPPIGSLERLRDSVSMNIIASGGVSCIEDIYKLKEIGMDGAIIGKAYYAGKIDLKEAVKVGGEQCLQKE